jgi:DNA-binding NarL/FixJ family response regulator
MDSMVANDRTGRQASDARQGGDGGTQERGRQPSLLVIDGDGLTPWEIDVLRALVNGAATGEIADALGIARGAVKTQMKSIARKLSAS